MSKRIQAVITTWLVCFLGLFATYWVLVGLSALALNVGSLFGLVFSLAGAAIVFIVTFLLTKRFMPAIGVFIACLVLGLLSIFAGGVLGLLAWIIGLAGTPLGVLVLAVATGIWAWRSSDRLVGMKTSGKSFAT